MEAITIEETAIVNKDRCIVCGVCVGACFVDAVKLYPKDQQHQYVPPVDIIDMQIRITRERGII